MKKVAFLVQTKDELWEGMRSSLGLVIENNYVTMVVLDQEVEMTDEYKENLEWFVDMEGEFYSNVPANVEKHGFQPITIGELGEKLKEMDTIVPF
ncbi:MAG: hypothetical protein EHM75_08910 [Desulfobacteraceae bacterium]|nr:MAG: hypothetical protein EHM75_08910 [Desulfobacteraceae bacterium]